MALQICKAFNFQLTLKFMAVTYVHLSMELFSNDQYCLLSSVACAAVVYCRYGVKNQESINQCCHHTCNVCFYLGVMSQARIFFSNGDVTLIGEGPDFDLHSALIAIEQ